MTQRLNHNFLHLKLKTTSRSRLMWFQFQALVKMSKLDLSNTRCVKQTVESCHCQMLLFNAGDWPVC